MELEASNLRAPELYGDHWFNAQPVSIRDLRGQVILVDFWDFTSMNCIHALEYVKEWHKKYQDFGLVVVGVHTPEFKFARKVEVVERAINRAQITYPVVLDNEAFLWSAFGARSWPTKILIDKDGYVRYSHQGEGGYQQFERALQQLIVQSGFRGRLPDLTDPLREADSPGILCHRATGEMHLGYLKFALGNIEGYNPESIIDYVDPEIYLAERFYAKGKWLSTRECFSYQGEQGESGSVIVQYDAAEVNAVMNPSTAGVSEVVVQQNGHSLSRECQGEDIVVGNDGASLVLVDSPKMYNLVKNREFGNHRLMLTTSSPNLEIYSFSFVTSVVSELIHPN
jgi:thiol-disulfide isomerase/thioredoxin